MRRLALASLLLVSCGGPSETDDALIRLERPDDPTVTFKVMFHVGSETDPPGKEGLAFVTGQLLAEGATERHTYEQILEKLYPIASDYDVRVDRELTVLSGRTHRDNLDRYYPLFTDAYLKPKFSEEDFERVRTDALNHVENTLRFASDEELGKAALQSFVFAGTRQAHPVSGTVEGLRGLTAGDVRQFWKTHFTAPRTVFGIAGGFDADLAARFAQTRDALPQGSEAEEGGAAGERAPEIEGRHVLLVDKPGADASISFGFPLDVRRGDPDYYALWVANSWLGEHRNTSSHLFQVIRERRGLNYGDYSYIEAFPEGGRRQFPPNHVGVRQPLFQVWIRTLPNEQAHFALRAAVRELETLVEQGMDEEAFSLTRSFLRKYILHYADTTSRRLGYKLDDRYFGIDDPGHLERFREAMRTMTVEDVNAALRRHLGTEHMKIAIVTGAAADLAKALASGAPSPIEYPSPKPEAILEEDPKIASYPLGIAAENVRTIPVAEIFER